MYTEMEKVISNLTKKLTYNKFLLCMWIAMMDLLPIHW